METTDRNDVMYERISLMAKEYAQRWYNKDIKDLSAQQVSSIISSVKHMIQAQNIQRQYVKEYYQRRKRYDEIDCLTLNVIHGMTEFHEKKNKYYFGKEFGWHEVVGFIKQYMFTEDYLETCVDVYNIKRVIYNENTASERLENKYDVCCNKYLNFIVASSIKRLVKMGYVRKLHSLYYVSKYEVI